MARRLAALRRRQAGFTLIELMVTVTVATLLGLGILSLFDSVTKVFANQNNRILSQDGARLAMQQMSRYIRSSASSASRTDTRSDAIAVANPQELVIYVDVDGDGNSDKIRFYLSGTELRIQTVAPNMAAVPPTYAAFSTVGYGTLTVGVRNGAAAIFTYYRYNDTTKELEVTNQTSAFDDLEKIVGVGIALTVNEVPQLSTSGATFNTKVQLRQRYNGGLTN